MPIASTINALTSFRSTALLGLLVIVVTLAFGLLNHPNYVDEFYYLGLINYYTNLPLFTPLTENTQHNISIGPLYFIAQRFWTEIAGPGDPQSRLLSLFEMLLASVFWNLIGQRLGSNHNTLRNIAFWVLPYHLIYALTCLAEPFMTCFMLMAFWLWILAFDSLQSGHRRPSIIFFCLSGLALGIAQNAKQPLITVSLSLAVFGLIRVRFIWAIIGPLLAIVFQIPFWLKWGNMFPPGMRNNVMPQFADWSGFFPDTSLHLLSVAGLAMWPAFRFDYKSRPQWLILLSGLILWFSIGPDMNPNNEFRYRFGGTFLQLSHQAPQIRFLYVIPFLVGWNLFCSGILDIALNRLSIPRQALIFIAIITIILFVRSPLAFDRYASCFLGLWYLAKWPALIAHPRLLMTSLAMLLALAIAMVERL